MASTYIPEPIVLRLRKQDLALCAIYALEPAVALAALILLAPVLVALACAIAASSRRSPLVWHGRVGRHGAPLQMLKFRTMWNRRTGSGSVFRVEEIADYIPEFKTAPDPRVTSRFAAWCRRHSLDELPQLVHVVRREMSFIGPRPITRAELDRYYGPAAAEVLSTRPGLVGLWQVMGRNHLTYARRRRLDLLFVRHCCARLYMRILLRSISRVLSGNGAY